MIATLQELRVKDVMTSFVHVIGASWPLSHVAEFMIEHEISGAPVATEEGTLIGVISQTDLLRYMAVPNRQPVHHAAVPAELARAYAEEELTGFETPENTEPSAVELMTSNIFRINADTTVRDAATLMRNGHIHRLFVTEGGRIIGIVSAFDLLQVIHGMLDQVLIQYPTPTP